jgi:hypothetical protein
MAEMSEIQVGAKVHMLLGGPSDIAHSQVDGRVEEIHYDDGLVLVVSSVPVAGRSTWIVGPECLTLY